MKKTILTMAVMAIFAITATTSFGQSTDKKSETSKKDDSQQNSNITQRDSVADFQSFKSNTDARFLKNEKSLADWKQKVSQADVNRRAEYEKNLTALNQRNVELRKRYSDYKLDGKSNWSSFKTQYNSDLDKFENELKDFTIDNK